GDARPDRGIKSRFRGRERRGPSTPSSARPRRARALARLPGRGVGCRQVRRQAGGGATRRAADRPVTSAVDSSMLFSILRNEPAYAQPCIDAIAEALTHGPLIACPVVYAETAAYFEDPATVDQFLESYQIALDPFTP